MKKTLPCPATTADFSLKIFPYFLTVNGTPTLGSTAVATRFSGGKPEGFALPPTGTNARVKIGDTVYPYTSYNDRHRPAHSLQTAYGIRLR